jgi:phage-related protein
LPHWFLTPYSDITILRIPVGENISLKPVKWVGSSLRDLCKFPDSVQDHVGYALYVAQCGGKHRDAKTLSGFGGAGVVEVVTDFRGDTFRAVYTVRYAGAVYVLHAFQKKSKSGSETPNREIELIRRRLREAEEMARERTQ